MSLAKHVDRMTNKELNALAQNRFIDDETQIEIAAHHYLRCRNYLAENANICDKAVEMLMAGKSNTCKWTLVQAGRLNSHPDLIEKVYKATPARWRSTWRMGITFVTGMYWYGRAGRPTPNTSKELLKEIYLEVFRPRMGSEADWRYNNESHYAKQILRHPNCDEELAVVMSTSTNEELKRAAFDRLVEIKRGSDDPGTTLST